MLISMKAQLWSPEAAVETGMIWRFQHKMSLVSLSAWVFPSLSVGQPGGHPMFPFLRWQCLCFLQKGLEEGVMGLPRAGAASYTAHVSVCVVHSVCRKWFPGQSCHRGVFLYELSLVLPTTNAVFPFIIRKRDTETRLISLHQ